MRAAFELVDVSASLPGLVRRPGLPTWRPPVSRDLTTFYNTYAEFIESLDPPQRSETKLQETHWPPANANELNLQRWYAFHSLTGHPTRLCVVSGFIRICKILVHFLWRSCRENLNRLYRLGMSKIFYNHILTRISHTAKRSAETAAENLAEPSKKQKTSETMDEDPQPVQTNDDEPAEKQGKSTTFKELPYVFLSDGSKHLEQAM